MATYKAPNYRSGQTHQGEHGNCSLDLIQIEIQSAWASGDVIELDVFQNDCTYESIQFCSEGATGLTMSAGYNDLDGAASDLTAFSTDTDVATAGRTELLNFPYEMREANSRDFRHALAVTLGGTVTAGDVVWLVARRVFHGSN